MANALDEEFFTSILEDNKEAVRSTIRDALLDGVKRQFEWELPETVKQAVRDFMNDEIVPAVRAELLANKDEFVDAATAMIRGVPVEIGKAMQKHVAEALTNSYKIRKLLEGLL